MKTLKRARIVTSFLEHGGKILILKRSDSVRTYRGKWAGVSGSIEKDETPFQAAVREIREETGLGEGKIDLEKEGESFLVADDKLGSEWIIHPFLFKAKTGKVKIDWEHSEARWIKPGELARYDTVPKLAESLRKVLGK